MSKQKSKLKAVTKDRSEIASYMKMDTEELYRMLAMDQYKTKSAYFSKYPTLEKGVPSQKDLQDSLAEGKHIFDQVIKESRKVICSQYKEKEDNVQNVIDLAVLIAPILIGTPMFAGVSVIAVSVLVFKIGIKELCRGQKS